MREILFRGKRKGNDNWIDGGFCEYRNFSGEDVYNIIHNGYSNEVIPETVGQYTGLTDKNGKKIFEGDICKHRSNYSGEYIITVVTYTDGQFLSMADNNSGFNLSDKFEVIGNIHDNPELLGGGEE
jgi:uncharacterized phage protein (TIGR01671 family)